MENKYDFYYEDGDKSAHDTLLGMVDFSIEQHGCECEDGYFYKKDKCLCCYIENNKNKLSEDELINFLELCNITVEQKN
ncbi:MAG: hypothetical protein ACOCRK_03455 [bacterium]